MARRKSKMTVGAKYVAIGALYELLIEEGGLDHEEAGQLAEEIVRKAWDVEHFPVAGKVQITLDLGRLDQPADQPGPGAAERPDPDSTL